MPKSYPRLRELVTKDGGTYRVVHAGDTLAWDPAVTGDTCAPALLPPNSVHGWVYLDEQGRTIAPSSPGVPS